MARPVILVTNDDGIYAPGLRLLAEALEAVGEVWVYAPDRQQSGVGHGVSMHRPLRVTQTDPRRFMVDGTPTDCVMLAVRDLLKSRPQLVFSGINSGANLGDDVTYSGTVAGAYEGMLQGIHSVAMSTVGYEHKHMDTAAQFAAKLAQHILKSGLPEWTTLNVNVPDVPASEIAGVAITRMGRRHYEDEIITRHDPRGGLYYWIGGSAPSHHEESGTDFEAVEQKKISITPLHRDMTNHAAIASLAGQNIEF
ncbi:MAG: 5'/3'-nucleotidase SurE [Candidatus Hydrogenedentes bacterium]|nr:5'/3'-nucleotidase SurE [Candidatus Hydrogenedentota bacterium]